jgi:hypothetical protein
VLLILTEDTIQLLPDGVQLSEDLDWLEPLKDTTVCVLEVPSPRNLEVQTVVIQVTGTAELLNLSSTCYHAGEKEEDKPSESVKEWSVSKLIEEDTRMSLLGVKQSKEPNHTITVPKEVGSVLAEKVLGLEMPDKELTLHKDGTAEFLNLPSTCYHVGEEEEDKPSESVEECTVSKLIEEDTRVLFNGVKQSEELLHTITVPKKVGSVLAEKVLGLEILEQDLTLHKDGTAESQDLLSISEDAHN